jgi:hypothetical protein
MVLAQSIKRACRRAGLFYALIISEYHFINTTRSNNKVALPASLLVCKFFLKPRSLGQKYSQYPLLEGCKSLARVLAASGLLPAPIRLVLKYFSIALYPVTGPAPKKMSPSLVLFLQVMHPL